MQKMGILKHLFSLGLVVNAGAFSITTLMTSTMSTNLVPAPYRQISIATLILVLS